MWNPPRPPHPPSPLVDTSFKFIKVNCYIINIQCHLQLFIAAFNVIIFITYRSGIYQQYVHNNYTLVSHNPSPPHCNSATNAICYNHPTLQCTAYTSTAFSSIYIYMSINEIIRKYVLFHEKQYFRISKFYIIAYCIINIYFCSILYIKAQH